LHLCRATAALRATQLNTHDRAEPRPILMPAVRPRQWLPLLLLSALAGCNPPRAGGSAEQLAAVSNGCVQAMLRSTCRVMNDTSKDMPVSEVVLIAGVGRVDAKSYRALREAGDGMCAQIQASCGSDWEGAQCRTARALWGGDAHKPR
jgi:hypothetical protein